MDKNSTYYIVDEKVLPQVYKKVILVKHMLKIGKYENINKAVKAEKISRSAFYKYKDYIYPFYESSKGRLIEFLITVEDISGLLSKIVGKVAESKANIVTIDQNIPIDGIADINISIETNEMEIEINELINGIIDIKGVKKIDIIARK